MPTGNAAPDSDLIPFIDNRNYNIFRRTNLDAGTMHIQLLVTDSNGCSALNGNITAVPAMHCVGFDGDFTIGNTTGSSIEIASVHPGIVPGRELDISLDGGASFTITGVVTPYNITGLGHGAYRIVVKYKCMLHPGVFTFGLIGPKTVTI